MPPLPFPIESSQTATIALTAVYCILSILCYSYVAIWRYLPYLSSSLGAGGKFIGFLLRAIFIRTLNVDVYAASTVFITAGMSSCTSAQAVVLSDWFKNSSAAQQLKLVQSRPRMLPAVARLISLPVIIFGPGIGVPAAILMFGVNTPNAIKHANRIRRWSAWGTMACLSVLASLGLLALQLELRGRRQANSKGSMLPLGLTLLSMLLLAVSAASRVHALYDSYFFVEDRFFYTLVALPELLQQLISAFPVLMLAAGHADRYQGWRTATWPWVQRRFPPPPCLVKPSPEATGGKGSGTRLAAVAAEAHLASSLPAADSAKTLGESCVSSQSSCQWV